MKESFFILRMHTIRIPDASGFTVLLLGNY